MPSIAVGDLAGQETVTRTLTNVGGRRASYRPVVRGLSGVQVTVTPQRLTRPPGGSRTVGTGQDTGSADFAPSLPGNYSQTLTVGGPGELVRIQVLADHGADDLDLYLVGPDG